MSAFKRINNSDVVVLPYVANKTYQVDSCDLYSEGVKVFSGERVTGSFSPGSESEPVTNDQYDRLMFDMINNMFYQQFSGSYLNTSSLASSNFYQSLSIDRPSGSYYDYASSPYMIKNFPTGANDTIKVISIPKNMFGSSVKPGTFAISSSAYLLYDDQYGNIWDSNVHVGNIFYAQGLAIITNQDYQGIFQLPPYAADDDVTFKTNDFPKLIYPLTNDDGRGAILDTGSIQLYGASSSYFNIVGNGSLAFTGYTEGVYEVYYTVNSILSGSNCPTPYVSNKGKITVTVTPGTCGFVFDVEVITTTSTTTTSTTSTTTSTTSTTSTTTTAAPVYIWVEDTYTCAQDNPFTLLSQINNLSSPSVLLYDSTSSLVYGVDVDNLASGTFFSYDPLTAVSASDLSRRSGSFKPGAEPWIFYSQIDREKRRIYSCGRDSDGLQVYDIATDSVSVVPYGFNENVPPMGGSGSHNGYNRLFIGLYENTIITTCKYAEQLYIIDRDSLTITNTIDFTSIPNYDKCLIGGPIIVEVGSEYWVIQSQANIFEAPNQDSSIYRYDSTFSSNLGTIPLSGSVKIVPNYNNYARSAFVNTVTNQLMVIDLGSNKLFNVDLTSMTVTQPYTFNNRGDGFNYSSLGFIRDPVSGDLFLSGGYFVTGGDTTSNLVSFLWDEINNVPLYIYPGLSFGVLERIGTSNKLHGTYIGNVGWNPATGWDTDGLIQKFSR